MIGRVLTASILVASVSAAVGCNQRKLFPETSYNSQYERYEYTHGRQRQSRVMTAFGREAPNIKELLKPLRGP